MERAFDYELTSWKTRVAEVKAICFNEDCEGVGLEVMVAVATGWEYDSPRCPICLQDMCLTA